MEQTTPRSFVRTYLPWLAAAGVLVLYLVTLNKEVSLSSVFSAARWTALDWRPTLISPLTWLVTLPVRFLPAGIQLVGLNLISAVCAAASAGLLARSVALLPHDRTHDQRLREQSEDSSSPVRTAWIAPLFAVLLLGLQRSFWENAIVCTGDIIDVLLVAYVIRCVLEFRDSERDGWLWKLALVYGLGIANDFAFIAFAPAMLVAIVWLKKLKLFEYAFLFRFCLFGVLGLCLYFLLPIAQALNDVADIGFWQALRMNVGYQKGLILGFPRIYAYWLGGYPLILLLVISIKWASGFGDTSRIGGIFSTAFAHLLHLALLAFTICMALDLPGSPRQVVTQQNFSGLTFLATYYMSALAAGYFVGYLLLVFSDFTPRSRRPAPALMVPLSYLVTFVVCAAAIAVPVKLIIENWSSIRSVNASEFRDYARQLLQSLPKQPTVVLSDDLARLYGVALVGGRQQGHVLLDTRSLTDPGYYRYLTRRHGSLLPPMPPDTKQKQVPAFTTLDVLDSWKQKMDLFYLHPSFGYILEVWYLEPHELVYRLNRYPTNTIEPPLPTAEVIKRQTDTWARLAPTLKNMEARVAKITKDDTSLHADLVYASRAYSQGLDWWAVELQRANRFDEAFPYLNEALALNPDNASAFITREANIEWRKSRTRLQSLSEQAQEKLKKSHGIEELLNTCGPVDEPSFHSEIMQVFTQTGLWREAAREMLRALAFAPDDPAYNIALANIYLGWNEPDRALAIVQTVRSKNSVASLPPAMAVDLDRSEAAAMFVKDDFPRAETILKRTKTHYPEQDGSYLALSQLYVSRADNLRRGGKAAEASQMLTNAVAVAEEQIRQQPTNAGAYFNHGNLCMLLPDYPRAIDSFKKVLEFDPKNFAALFNRAIANLQSKRLDDAERDYLKLLDFTSTSFKIYYGLGEIAYQRQNWKDARDYYRSYLQYAPRTSDETQFVKKRLDELKKK